MTAAHAVEYYRTYHCSVSNIQCIIQRQTKLQISIPLPAYMHMHDYKISVLLSTLCGLRDSAGKCVTVEDLQSSRRSARGSSIASKASGPNDLEVCLAGQTPLLHWQSRTLAVCILPKPCRSLTSMGTLYTPVGSSLVCFNVADVSVEETHVM